MTEILFRFKLYSQRNDNPIKDNITFRYISSKRTNIDESLGSRFTGMHWYYEVVATHKLNSIPRRNVNTIFHAHNFHYCGQQELT